MKVIITIIIFLSGCVTTTKNSDSNVSRLQLLLLPNFMTQSMSEEAYKENLEIARNNNKLNVDKELLSRLRNISYEIIEETSVFRDDSINWNWEINLEENDEVNAYCMPGGKIMVFSGLVEKLNTTDDEIAAIIGHEIAHALREHGRERMSNALIQQVGILGFAMYLSDKDSSSFSKQTIMQGVALGTTLFFALPNSREQEREADKIGLELSARAGYNPMAAVSLWRKMSEQSDAKIPEFLSTHPTHENRIEDLQKQAREIKYLYLDAKK
tara:strand:+ start:778 stop:1587 length:810 start_codon:yes stop_codon:yes gene_type:complete